jgi:type IV pilus assembly protein PilE
MPFEYAVSNMENHMNIARTSLAKASRLPGFTLIELMITLAIVAILAAVALPSYQQYVLRGKFAEAAARLAGDRVRLEQYYQDNRTYADFSAVCVAGAVKAALPAGEHFDYSCSIGADGQTYTLFATGRAATAGFEFSINQSNTRQTVSVPAGWDLPGANCWVQRKGGTC